MSELEDILKSDYYKSHLGYDQVDWFVIEVIKLGNKVPFYFEKTGKDTVLTEEDEEDCRKNIICSFCQKNTESKKVGVHCQLTGKYRGPAQKNGKINDTQDKSKDIPFIFHKSTNYVCHIFSEKLVDKKNDKVKFDIIPETNEEYISVRYGSIRFIASYKKEANEKLFYSNLQDRRDKQAPKYKQGQLVRTAEIKRNFSKGDSTKCSYILYTLTEVKKDTIPSYRIKYLPERCFQTLLLPTKLFLEQNNQKGKKLNLIQ